MKIKKIEEAAKPLSFKQLVKALSQVHSKDNANEVMGEIDNSFNQNKFSWDDHEMLYDLASKLYELYK